jgi:hypothetical protein
MDTMGWQLCIAGGSAANAGPQNSSKWHQQVLPRGHCCCQHALPFMQLMLLQPYTKLLPLIPLAASLCPRITTLPHR